MKNYLLVLVFVLVSLSTKAQQYHPLLDNTCWYQSYSSFGSQWQFYYYNDGDTLYNSITYQKYRRSSNYQYLFLLREDTIQRKVFIVYLAFSDSSEKTLYDFSLALGTQFTFYHGLNPYVATVTQIDSILTYVGYRKRWTGHVNSHDVWFVEQVGSIEDPIIFTNMGGDPAPKLVCNYNGAQQIYYYGLSISCPGACLTTGVAEVNNEMSFTISPNPTPNAFTIKDISSKEKSLVEIINVFGEIVYSKNLFGKNEYEVDTKFTKGVYFVRVSNEERNVVRKLVVE